MLAGPLVLCVVLRLAEGQVTTYEVAAQAEGRGLVRLQHGVPTKELAEAEVDPRLSLNLDTRTLSLTVGYAPRLWASTLTGRLQSLNRGALQATFRPDPLYRLVASATGVSGISDLLAPAVASPGGATPAPIQTVGSQTRIHYVFGELAAGLEATPTPRARLTLSGAYVVDGGEDAAARLTFPLQRGPRAALTFGWQTSADDKFETEAATSYRSFTTSAVDPVTGLPVEMPAVLIATFTETWRRKFGSELSTWLGLGGAVTGVAGVGGAKASVKAAPPVVDLGLQYVSEGGLQRLRLSGRYSPLVDSLTGRIYQRADAALAAAWSPWRTWQMVGELTTGVAIGGAESGQAIVVGEARMVHGLSREVELTWGARGLWQHPPANSTVVSYKQWGLFVALAYLHRDTI